MTPTTASYPAPVHTGQGARRSMTRRLLALELRLVARDPFTLIFVVGFPILCVLTLGGVFGTEPAHGFPINPSHYYIASYFTVMIGAVGLVMLPTHIASYRERGVLRRFTAAGFSPWSFLQAEACLGLISIAVASVALLLVAAPVYGVPPLQDPLRAGAGIVVASLAFVAIGVLLGTLLPTVRAAQAVGLLLYFPSILLGVGGPPTSVMPPIVRAIAENHPLALASQAIRDPWLGLGEGSAPLLIVATIAVAAAALAVPRSRL